MGTVRVVLAARLARSQLHTPYAMIELKDSFEFQQLAGMLLLRLDSTSAEVDTAVNNFAVVDTPVDT